MTEQTHLNCYNSLKINETFFEQESAEDAEISSISLLCALRVLLFKIPAWVIRRENFVCRLHLANPEHHCSGWRSLASFAIVQASFDLSLIKTFLAQVSSQILNRPIAARPCERIRACAMLPHRITHRQKRVAQPIGLRQ